MALQVTDANFDELVNSGKPMVLDFWAEWCGPCRMVGPIIDELATEYDGKVIIGKLDVDNNDDVVTQFGIRNIPTILFFKDGKVVVKPFKVKYQDINAEIGGAHGFDQSMSYNIKMDVPAIVLFIACKFRILFGICRNNDIGTRPRTAVCPILPFVPTC